MNPNNTLYIVVPCYKEQEVLPETSKRLKEKVLQLRAQGKISDKSRLLIDPDAYRNDISLKGEFVRRVLASNLKEEEKERVIACGFRALSGEEMGL